MSPDCPKGYDCTFTPVDPPFLGPWWEGTWGIVIAILALIALVAIMCTVSYHLLEARKAKLNHLRWLEQERHKLAMEEQRTMQVDAAKGNLEVLRALRS